MSKKNLLWGGRFSSGASSIMEEINQSISFDIRLAKQDILGSKAHCRMLVKTDILTEKEGKKIIEGLNEIDDEITSGKFTFTRELEDIHMNIESALHEKIGALAGKLHIARSRNDQVATDFKLWVRDALDCLDINLRKLQSALLTQASKHAGTIMPGFTHLQSAQPVTFGHHLMAYTEMFKRDRSRIAGARSRLNECPLGVAALAGTSFPIDREMTAKELGFDRPTANSLDSVSDRDFALDYLSLVAICSIHLSRLAEEMVLWSSQQFNFIRLSDAFSTGSSIMPQKRNPDAAELIRGKCGRMVGNLTSLLLTMKGLPLAYSKDMQEDKEPLFDSHDTIILAVSAMAGMVSDMQVNREEMYQAASVGYPTATELADWLVQQQGLSFREAHHISGKLVKIAEERGCDLKELDLPTLQSIEPKITEALYERLTIESAVNSKTSLGGTAVSNVINMVDRDDST